MEKFVEFFKELEALEKKYGITVQCGHGCELFFDGGEKGDYTYHEVAKLAEGENSR